MFVWTEPWIEDNGRRAPWRKNTFFDVSLRVSALIDPNTGSWNPDVLEEHFFPQDIDRIKVFQPVRDHKDFHVWKHNKSGDYSVKSGYWCANQENKSQVSRESEVQPSLNGIKAEVWSILTNSKIKIFLWKVLSGALPVAMSLKSRGVMGDERCQVCGEEGETINHILFKCHYARQVWALSDYPTPESGFQNGSVFSNVNSLCFDGKSFSPLETNEKITEGAEEWFAAQVLDNEDSDRRQQNSDDQPMIDHGELSVSWSRPQESWVKCNVGFSWSNRNMIAGGAWVVRNDEGIVLLHIIRAFSNLRDKDEGGFRVLEWAMKSMVSHGMSNVIFAIQNKTLVGALKRPRAWPSFRFQAMELNKIVEQISGWVLEVEMEKANRGAGLIAQSVTRDSRMQSYVIVSYPQWLHLVFEEETLLSSAC
ncbi:PREDICTED: uncharacterized protein LOC104704124 [Camelina sativa]|uniref:Uncharacterized protein LOC104704124 n=1 Tax=Camelina sativa TaxID=90675 RepID=A0ABM0SZW0_CAMSA|nr:PREDICTED: uncharacterized protein LOC104704124 [Camelina sativa]